MWPILIELDGSVTPYLPTRELHISESYAPDTDVVRLVTNIVWRGGQIWRQKYALVLRCLLGFRFPSNVVPCIHIRRTSYGQRDWRRDLGEI